VLHEGELARMVMRRLNCWEYQGCGFGPNGDAAGNSMCPSASAMSLDGHNGGKNGGRSCWVISGTLCDGSPSPDYENKLHICKKCAFHHRVAVEEGINYVDSETLLSKYRNCKTS